MEISQLIKALHITEKTHTLAGQKRYTLLVNKEATKNQVKDALKKVYKVHPLKINIVNIKSHKKKIRTRKGELTRYKPGFKKAIVVLAKDEKIPGFEVEK